MGISPERILRERDIKPTAYDAGLTLTLRVTAYDTGMIMLDGSPVRLGLPDVEILIQAKLHDFAAVVEARQALQASGKWSPVFNPEVDSFPKE